MMEHESIAVDVAVIGGGPAGISACLELSRKSPNLKIALFESEEELGGMPRTCHLFFGMRDLRRIYTGPGYARKLNDLLRKTHVDVYTQTTALDIVPGAKGENHFVRVVSPDGLKTYRSRFLVLATGCCESSLGERLIPSARPAGIFTTWQLQQIVNLHHLKPGNRALVIGSEDAALSTVMTLKRAGISIAGMVEEDKELQTYPLMAQGLSGLYGFPIYRETSVNAISGIDRVEGVELVGQGKGSLFHVTCDTVILSGRFRPISQLIHNTPIARDEATSGPSVDMNLMTSVPNIFAAGNVLRGGDMHDLCALEGKNVAESILARMSSTEDEGDGWISLRAIHPIRYVVPQKISPSRIRRSTFPSLLPGVSIQVAHTLRGAILEAWSGEKKIWEKTYGRVIANHRVPIPVGRFNWDGVDFEKGIELRVNGSHLKALG